jgi:hypothetical protein
MDPLISEFDKFGLNRYFVIMSNVDGGHIIAKHGRICNWHIKFVAGIQ